MAQADPPGFEGLFTRERSAMVRLATLVVGSGAVAEEVVQDSFIALSARWETVDNHVGYLRVSVLNGCRMELRRRSSEQRNAARWPALSPGSPSELVELQDALGAISERQRMVLVLRYLQDLPDDQIADALGCLPATVRSLARRGLRAMRRELQ